jgi:hypothetical protein
MKRRTALATVLGGAISIPLGQHRTLFGARDNATNPERDRVRWQHLSTKYGDLPVPSNSLQQTGLQILDIDHDGLNDFYVSVREGTPALVWYRRSKRGWTKYLIEPGPLHIEAGGAACDVDGDGDMDIIMGGDWKLNEVWWWENPYPHYDHETPWKRYLIKNSGATQHHDQIVADFDGDGKPELVFWNQGANTLYLARVPKDPKNTQPWPYREIYSSPSKSEGLAAADIDGDGKLEIIGGGRWFKHQGGMKFTPHVIDDKMRDTRAAAGSLVKGGRPQVVFVVGDGVGRLKWYEWKTGDGAHETWAGHDLLGHDVIHGHSLQIADLDGDGNLDIFCGEMGKWTESSRLPDNPHARTWIFYGDGRGNFTRTLFSEGVGTHEAKVGDLDGDGRLDIVGKPYNWETPRLDIWLNQGNAAGPR